MNKTLTIEEKIDYIYNTLKKNERKALISWVLKWWFRLFILIYMYYFITVWLPNMIDRMIPEMPNFANMAWTWSIDVDSLKQSFSNILNR